MKGDKFQFGDAVHVSAAHIRSICPNAARGWPTTLDPGKGMVCNVAALGDFDLVEIYFWNSQQLRTYNSNILIYEKDVYNDAMRAEHSPRGYGL